MLCVNPCSGCRNSSFCCSDFPCWKEQGVFKFTNPYPSEVPTGADTSEVWCVVGVLCIVLVCVCVCVCRHQQQQQQQHAHTHTHTHSHTLTHVHTHTHALTHSLTHSQPTTGMALSVGGSLYCNTGTNGYTLSVRTYRPHTHTHTHTHTHQTRVTREGTYNLHPFTTGLGRLNTQHTFTHVQAHYTHAHTHTHTHSHTHTSLSISIHTHFLSRAHAHTHTLSLSLLVYICVFNSTYRPTSTTFTHSTTVLGRQIFMIVVVMELVIMKKL